MTHRSRIVDLASRLLEPAEREVVLGDLTESNAGGVRPVFDVLGLAARRQLSAWGSWQPWFVLVLIVFPIGLLLSIVSRFWADGIAGTVSLYVTRWNGPLFHNPGGRAYVMELTGSALLHATALACWSWTCGATFRALSLRTSWVNGAVFLVVLFAGAIGTTTTRQADHTTVLSLAVRAATIVVPAVLALTYAQLRPTRVLLWTTAALTLTFLTMKDIESALFFGWQWRHNSWFQSRAILHGLWMPGPDGFVVSADDVIAWPLRVLPFLTLWPITVTLASAALHYRHDATTARHTPQRSVR